MAYKLGLLAGPGSSKLGIRTTAAIVFGRLVLVPPAGLGIVMLADKLGFLPPGDKMFRFVLLLQHSMPTSVLSGNTWIQYSYVFFRSERLSRAKFSVSSLDIVCCTSATPLDKPNLRTSIYRGSPFSKVKPFNAMRTAFDKTVLESTLNASDITASAWAI